MKKRMIALFLTAALLLVLLLPAWGAEAKTETVFYPNPLYGCEEEGALSEQGETLFADSASDPTPVVCKDVAAAGAVVRAAFRQRTEVIAVSVPSGSTTAKADCSAVWEAALRYTGNAEEGDYQRWMYQCYTATLNRADGRTKIVYTVTYYTTAEQETKVSAEVSRLLAEMKKTCSTDYELVRAIYDYICTNVTYDREHASDQSYKGMFTAYNALFEGTAVCQGYALLFYRMALEAGIPCRMIAGISGQKHAWNIVRLDGSWYNIDTTWGASTDAETWFLKGSESFTNHTAGTAYSTAAFRAIYPISETDYVPEEKAAEQTDYTVAALFDDISQTDWFTPYVQAVYDGNLMSGMGEGTFSPKTVTTRAQLVQMLYAMNGRPEVTGDTSFTDVPEGCWYEKAVQWAAETGVTAGRGDGLFSPNDPVTRQEIAVFLYAAAERPEIEEDLSGYADQDSVSGWAASAVSWCVAQRIMCGSVTGENTMVLEPASGAARCETAVMLSRYSALTA